MFAADATDGNRDIKDGLFERIWWLQRLTGIAIEQWTDPSPGNGVLVPEIESQRTLPPPEQNGTLQRGPGSVRRQLQPVPCNEQIVRVLHTNHVKAHQGRSDNHRMAPVHSHRVYRLKPREWLASFIDVTTVGAKGRHRTTALLPTNDVSPGEVLVHDGKVRVAVDARDPERFQDVRGETKSRARLDFFSGWFLCLTFRHISPLSCTELGSRPLPGFLPSCIHPSSDTCGDRQSELQVCDRACPRLSAHTMDNGSGNLFRDA